MKKKLGPSEVYKKYVCGPSHYFWQHRTFFRHLRLLGMANWQPEYNPVCEHCICLIPFQSEVYCTFTQGEVNLSTVTMLEVKHFVNINFGQQHINSMLLVILKLKPWPSHHYYCTYYCKSIIKLATQANHFCNSSWSILRINSFTEVNHWLDTLRYKYLSKENQKGWAIPLSLRTWKIDLEPYSATPHEPRPLSNEITQVV